MAINVSKSGGIYAEVNVDLSKLPDGLKKANDMAKSAATGISVSLSDALTPKDIARSINQVTGYFTKIQQSANALKQGVSQYDNQFRDLGRTIGIAEKDLAKFSATQQKALQNKLTREYEKNVRGLNRALGETETEATRAGGAIEGLTRKVAGLAAAYVSVREASRFTGLGVNFNSEIEDTRIGVAAVLANTQKIEDSQGRLLRGQEAFNGALQISTDIVKALDAETNVAAADFSQLQQAFQTSLAPAAQLGATWEENLRLVSDTSNALRALNIDMGRLDSELLAILTGRNASQSRLVQGLGIKPEDLKRWREAGTLIQEVNSRLENFRYAGEASANTFSAVSRDLRGTFESLAGDLTQGLFGGLTQGMQELSRSFYVLEKDGATHVYKLRKEIEPLVTLGQDIATSFGEGVVAAVRSFTSGLERLSSFVEENRNTINALGDAVRYLVSNIDNIILAYATYRASLAAITKAGASWETGLVRQIRYTGVLRTSLVALSGAWPLLAAAGVSALVTLGRSHDEGAEIARKYGDAILASASKTDEAAEAAKRLSSELSALGKNQLDSRLRTTREDLQKTIKEFDNLRLTSEAALAVRFGGSASGIRKELDSLFDALKRDEIAFEDFIEGLAKFHAQGSITKERLDDIVQSARNLTGLKFEKTEIENAIEALGDLADSAKIAGSSLEDDLGGSSAELEKALARINDEIARLTMSEKEYAAYKLDQKIAEYEKLQVPIKKLNELRAANVNAELRKQLEKDLKVQQDFWKDYAEITAGGYSDVIKIQERSLREQYVNNVKGGVQWEAAYELYLERLKDITSKNPVTIEIDLARDRLEKGEGSFSDGVTSSLGSIVEDYTNAANELSKVWGDFFSSFSKGFSDSIGKAIVYGDSLKDSLADVARSALSSLISGFVQLGIQMAINAALGQSLAAQTTVSTTALGIAQAKALAAAYAPAAAAASLATGGGNSGPAMAGISATYGLTESLSLAGFQKGGYTGQGREDEIAGVVHRGEYVMPAPVVDRIGVPTLEALSSGRGFEPSTFSGASASSSGGGGIHISIENYGTTKEFEVEQLSPEEVRIIARDVMRKEVPSLVASDLANPNSPESKSLRRNTSATWRAS